MALPGPARLAGTPAFSSWVTARSHALLRFCYVLTGDLSSADRLVEQVLSAAYLRWARLCADDQLEARLQAMAVRTYVGRNGHGRRGADVTAEGRDRQVFVPSPEAPGPDLDSVQIWQRCAGLTPRQRAALVLRCHDGLAAAEIASVTGGRAKAAAAEVDTALDVVVPGPHAGRDIRASWVRDAFREYAERAPQAYSPVERAVALAGRRRRRRVVSGGTLAAVLAVPVVWGLLAGSPSPARPPAPPDDLVPPAVDTRGWRWESWGGVQVQVPDEWGYGDLTQWCVTRGPDGPAVDRPEMVSTRAVCSLLDDGRPTYTGGLLLRRASQSPRLSRADVAPYATVRIHTIGDVTLTVVDIEPAVGSAILASAEVVGRRDVNGCEPRRGRARPTPPVDRPRDGPIARVASVESVSVCRYGLSGWPRPTLIGSRRLTGRSAEEVLAALRAAPARPPSAAGPRCRGGAEELAVLELWPDGRAKTPTSVVVRYDGCRGHGVDDGLSRRGLTADVLAPILAPPWTGEVSADVAR